LILRSGEKLWGLIILLVLISILLGYFTKPKEEFSEEADESSEVIEN